MAMHVDGSNQPGLILSETAAAPLEIFLPGLAKLCVPTRGCRFLRQDAIFQKIESRCPLIASVRDITEVRQNIRISINEVMRAFNFLSDSLKSMLKHDPELPEN
jgi:hypothetical protein